MKVRIVRWAAAIGLTCMSASAALAQDKFLSRYTSAGLTSPQCKQAEDGVDAMSCKGPAGWVLNVGYPAFGVTISFRHEKNHRPALTPTQGRLVFINSLASKTATIEWRGKMRDGIFEPHAAIIRVLVLDAAQTQAMIEAGLPQPSARPAQILTVTRLGREGSCLVAYVDAQTNPKPNDLARSVADEFGPATKCPVANVEIRGARTPVLASYLD